MKKRFLLFFLLLGSFSGLHAQVSDKAFVSVLTCGVGDEFYSTFGHSAIRFCDSCYLTEKDTMVVDMVYNWGCFDFNTKNFYFKFFRGKLDYWLSKQTYLGFLYEYQYEGRAVFEQRLNLTPEEVKKLYFALEENYMENNRYYRYDFFMDNCATRVRDMVNNNLIERNLFQDTKDDHALTFRQLLYPYMNENQEWWKFAIDIVLGQRCDQPVSSNKYMFAPNELMIQLDTTHLQPGGELLAGKIHQVLDETRKPLHKSFSPVKVFWFVFVFVLGITLIGIAKNKKMKWLDISLYSIVGLISLAIMFLWFFSDHYCAKMNWNILWCSPLFLYLAIRNYKANRWVVIIQMFLIVVMLVGFWSLPQKFNSAFYPVILALLIRLLNYFRFETLEISESDKTIDVNSNNDNK